MMKTAVPLAAECLSLVESAPLFSEQRPLAGRAPGLLPGSQKLAANRFEPKFLTEAIDNQTDWPVIFRITGPICARALEI
jgi:hypothetical protein